MSALHKKGMEMPIVIFVTLFVILAVALVLLNLLRGQITEKSSELKEIQRQSQLEQIISDSKIECKEACTDTAQNDCSPRSLANYCLRKVRPLDFNKNRATVDFDSSLLGGIGVCEDNVYCHHLQECACGQQLDSVNCVNILCKFWNGEGLTLAQADAILTNSYTVGSCATSPDKPAGSLMWNEAGGITFTCTAKGGYP